MRSKRSICAVIPAAGEGSRLGHALPKILVPITTQQTVWEILHSKLSPIVDHIHVILSENGEKLFEKQFHKNGLTQNVSTSIQPIPKGMGDAIFGAYDYWKRFDYILVLWGDQVNVSSQTLQSIIQAQEGAIEKTLALAINMVPDPYVQCDFNQGSSVLLNIRQSREGDICDEKGFADVGTFGLSTHTLMEAWQGYLQKPVLGKKTGEINFLPFLVYLSKELHWDLKLIEVKDPLESRGINTAEDLDFFRMKYSNGG